MGMRFTFPWDSRGNGDTSMPKMGMGMGRVHATIEMEVATFSHVPKLPSVDWMRMRCNKMLYCNVTSFFVGKKPYELGTRQRQQLTGTSLAISASAFATPRG